MQATRWMLMVLAFATLPAVSAADPPAKKVEAPAAKEGARVEAVVVATGKSVTLPTKTGNRIRGVVNGKTNIAKVDSDRANPSRVVIQGLKAGVSRLTLTDVNGGTETLIIAVEDPDDAAK